MSDDEVAKLLELYYIAVTDLYNQFNRLPSREEVSDRVISMCATEKPKLELV